MLLQVNGGSVVGAPTQLGEITLLRIRALGDRPPDAARRDPDRRVHGSNPERIIVDDEILRDLARFRGRRRRCRTSTSATAHVRARRSARLQLLQLQDPGSTRRPSPRRRTQARGDGVAKLTSSRSRRSTSRTSPPTDPPAKFDRLARPDRRRTCARRTSSRSRRSRTTTAPATTARRRRERDVRRAHRRDPGGRRPDLRVPADRPGRRPGRRRARRQHPGRLPLPHRPRAEFVDRPGGDADDRDDRRRRKPVEPQLVVSPGRIDPRTRRSTRQPQAARRRVPVRGPHATS